jgi:hypothetical protein
VRWITAIVVLLGIACWAAYRIDFPSKIADSPAAETTWRHTAAGWEKLPPAGGTAPAFGDIKDAVTASPHPAIVALFVALLSLLILVALTPDPPRKAGAELNPSCLPVGQLTLRSREWFEQANLPSD